jgi:hypothetical protein
MNDEKTFDHRPDPELGAALRRALDPPRDDQAAFVARVMARYDRTLAAATVPTWEVLARWSRRGIAVAATAAVLGGFLLGRVLQTPEPPETLDAALTPIALMNATDPPDASVVFASFVEQR